VRDVEDRVAVDEREAQERVSRVEVESVAALASTNREAKGFTRRIAPLEGDLAEVRRAREVVELNFRGLFNVAANAER
jgi:hypothetical protein